MKANEYITVKFDLNVVDGDCNQLVEVIKDDYYVNSEVCLGEYLGHVAIKNASINEVTYIFAKLHEDIEEDEPYIIIEGDTQRITDYL